MRITNKMSIMGVINNMQVNTQKLDKINRDLSSGRKINVPGDDPAGTVLSMGYRGNIEETQQYLRNVDSARNLLTSSDVAFGDLTNILQRVRELGVEGANGTYEQTSRDAIAAEITQLLDQVTEIGNTKVAGRYIFGGFQTMEPPFKKFIGSGDSLVGGPGGNLTDVDGNVRTGINNDNTTVVKYNGDNGRFITEIGENVTTFSNISGAEVFMGSKGGVNIFQTIMDLRDNLYRSDTTDSTDGKSVEKSLGELDKAIEQVLTFRSEVGAKSNRMEQATNKLNALNISVTQLLSKTEDTDVTKTIMDLKVQESVQRMSLSVGARIIQPTLVDFLK